MSQPDRIVLRSSPSEDVTPEMGVLLGHALAMDCKKVVVGMDLMRSSPMMKEALVAGLLSSGANVIDAGVTSCPALALAASYGDCAVYVTEYRGYGMNSGYLLINQNGSMFRKEQIRHLNKYLIDPPELPGHGGLGHVVEYHGALRNYNEKLKSLSSENAECSIVLDCSCGPVADSAPQALNRMGAELLTINGQRDPDFVSGEMDEHGICSDNVLKQMESETGYIGFAMNKIGTMTAVIDEKGRELRPDQVFALTIMFLKPERIAVPIDTTMLVFDAFHGRLDDDPPTEERGGLEITDIGVAAVCEAVSAGADLGYYDGGIIYGDVSLMPDGIRTATVIAGIAGGNSINRIIDGFPEYLRDRIAVECPCDKDLFKRKIEELLPDMEGRKVIRDGTWRVDMDGGWYLVRLVKNPDLSVEVTAESRDRAYLVGLMEIARDLVNECLRGQ